MKLAIWLLYILVALQAGFGAYNFEQIQASRAQGRAKQAAFNQAASSSLRTVLCFAETAALTSPRVTADERRRAVEFYEAALAKIHARPCK